MPEPRERADYWTDPMAIYVPICNSCDHQDLENGARCTAFPKGIPRDILTGDHDHHEPYTGDNGIRYVERAK